MNGLNSKYNDYEEFYIHSGNEKYEIGTILNNKYLIRDISIDNIKNQLIINAKTTPTNGEDKDYRRLKVSTMGNIVDEGPIYSLLRDGTLWYTDYYNNWIINGDTSKHRYLHPFSEANYDPNEWLRNFKDVYNEASATHYYNGRYFLKLNDKWNVIDKNFEVKNFNFKKHFPDKYSNTRMIKLEDRSPSYVIPREKRDSSLIKQIEYDSVFEKEVEGAGGWSNSTYSAGWWYMQIYMPGGDTLKIKRYSDYRGPDMKLYKIPEQYGGRNDVLFIVLEPKDAHVEQHGGMYVVRPRKLNQ